MLRFLLSILLAAVCAAVASSRVYSEFERVRLRVVTSPVTADEQVLTIVLPDLTRLASRRTAFVLRLHGGAEGTDVAVSLNGRRVTRAVVPAGQEMRVDAAAQVPPGTGHALTLTGSQAGWALVYLELANVHGYSQGIVDFLILPRDSASAGSMQPWIFAIVFGLLVPLRPHPGWRGRAHTAAYWAAATVILALFGAALLAEAFTPFHILLSLQTFLLGCAVLYAEPLGRLWPPARPHVQRALPHVRAWTRRWGPLVPYLALPALILWCVGQFYQPEVGFTPLIRFSEQFRPTAHPALLRTAHAVEPGSGYDGQFYAQLVFDPLLRGDDIVTALDSPGYRARRILFPWVAYLLGLGQPWLALQMYALLNVACWLALAWLLVRWLPPGSGRRTAAWCGCLLAEGMLASIRQSLVDGPSMLLLALGVLAVEQQRRWLAAGLLGISGLGRDTNVIGALTLAPPGARVRKVGALALQAALVAAPLLLWMAYLRHASFSPGETGYSNFAWPFAAYAQKWSVTLRELSASGWNSFARFSILSLVALTTQLLVLLYLLDWRNAWWRMGIGYAGLMLVVGEAVWYGYPGATARVVLPMTVAFNILLPRTRWFWPLWVAGNANVLVGLSAMRVPGIWEMI